MNVQEIPLSLLVAGTVGKVNPRRTGGSSIEEVKASIAEHGLLQNLCVVPRADGRFEVAAGNRRLEALQQLAAEGVLADDAAVLCKVFDDADKASAYERALAENVIRSPMHPADEFEAFAKLVDDGATVGDIASRFGVSILRVEQRLKLANIAPKLIDAYRAGDASQEQLMAYAASDDKKAQAADWDRHTAPWERRPEEIRRRLTKKEIDATRDHRARFVGVAAYEAAGGQVRRDLFGGKNAGFLGDAKLLDKLTRQRIDEIAESVKKEGWSFVEARPSMDYSELSKFGRLEPKLRSLTKDEVAEIESLEAQCRKLYDAEDDGRSGEGDGRIEELEEAIEKIKARAEQWTDAQREKSGALVYLSDRGLKIDRGRVRGGDKAARAIEKSKSRADSSGSKKDSGAPAPLSAALVQRLGLQQTQAIAAELCARPDVALVAVTHAIALRVIYRGDGYGVSALRIQSNPEDYHARTASALEKEVGATLARTHVEEHLKRWKALLPATSAELWPHMLGMTLSEVLQLLAVCASATVWAPLHDEKSRNKAGDALGAAVDLDMATWWTPTVANYLGSVPKTKVLAALNEAGLKADAARLAGGKSAPVAAEAEQLLADKGWLPKVFRRPAAKASAEPPAASGNAGSPSPASAEPDTASSDASSPSKILGAGKAERTPKPKAKPNAKAKGAVVRSKPAAKAKRANAA